VAVEVYDNATFDRVDADIDHTDANTITVDFAVAPTTDQYRVVVLRSGVAGAYATDIGNGSATDIVVTHGLETRDVVVQVYDNATFDRVDADVDHTTTNTVTIGFAVAPTTNQYRVVVLGDGQPTARGTDYICIQDQKADNVSAGTFTSGAWRTRTLNTEVADTGGHATLASNQITLAPGTYRLRASAPGEAVGSHKARFQNITDGTTVAYGTNEWSDGANGNAALTKSIIETRFTITATKTFELQHRCTTTRSGFGFGTANGLGVTEVYSTVVLERES
jgi:hypothetical protein